MSYYLEEYRKGKLSFGKAAEFAGLNLWEFIEEANDANIRLHFSLEDAEDEIRKIKAGTYDQFIEH